MRHPLLAFVLTAALPGAALAANPLPAPSDLTAVADASRVKLTWTPVADAAGYEIARQAPGEEKPTPLRKLRIPGRGPEAEMLDTGLDQGKTYAYTVRAFTDADPPVCSEPTDPVAVTTEPYVLKPEDLLFVYNAQARHARAIGANYCKVRGIRNPHVLRVKLPVGAELSRGAYEKKLLAPVRKHLTLHPRTTIIVLIRGIPWRIRESGRSKDKRRYHGWDRASVESELALARKTDYDIVGRYRNPLYGKAARLTPLEGILGVCRLDGPTDQVANDLVRRAVAAERLGVEGIAFLDAGGPYPMGNRALLRAAELLRKDGRLPVKVDEKKRVVDLSQVPGRIGFYYGWYAGHFRPKDKDFRFGRGAVAAHIHSFAGYSIAPNKWWVGPVLMHGATATLGTADEPLLDGFPMPDALTEALLQGRNFAEASLSASRYLSWMSMNIGDPLYRPFKPKE
jgi:uncharacterized protein (TIGR03790 family)